MSSWARTDQPGAGISLPVLSNTVTLVSVRSASIRIVVVPPAPAVPSAFSSEPAPRVAFAIFFDDVGPIVTAWLPLTRPAASARPLGWDIIVPK